MSPTCIDSNMHMRTHRVGLARCGTVFPVSVVVGAAVPAAVCRWGLCPRCPGVVEGIHIINTRNHSLYSGEEGVGLLAGAGQSRVHVCVHTRTWP